MISCMKYLYLLFSLLLAVAALGCGFSAEDSDDSGSSLMAFSGGSAAAPTAARAEMAFAMSEEAQADGRRNGKAAIGSCSRPCR